MGKLKIAISFVVFVLVVGLVLGRSYLTGPATAENGTEENSFQWVSPQQEKITLVAEEKECRLEQGACRLALENGEWIELVMEPRPFKPNVDLTLKVTASSEKVVPQEADFEGINLNMGYIRPTFAKGEDGVFTTQVVLPTCEEKTMDWKILVLTPGSQDKEAYGFYFSSEE